MTLRIIHKKSAAYRAVRIEKDGQFRLSVLLLKINSCCMRITLK